jgi:hypothetical protein
VTGSPEFDEAANTAGELGKTMFVGMLLENVIV